MNDKKISIAVIRRMPIYLRYLYELEEEGKTGISSKELSELTGFTASQIRQDFNNFGGFGQQGFGYSVSNLKKEIENILGYNNQKNTVIIGAGKLGQTVAKYEGFKKAGMNIIAIFDRNKNNIGTKINDLVIQDVKLAEDFLKKNEVQIGIICVSKPGAQEIANLFVESGVKGIWNFASTDLSVPEDVYVENVRLTESFLTLSYFMNNK